MSKSSFIIIEGLYEPFLFPEDGEQESSSDLPEWLASATASQLKNMEPEKAVRFSWKELDPNGEEARKVLEEDLPRIDMGPFGLYVPIGPKQDKGQQNERGGTG